jgi:hypothetical protein
VCAFPWVPGPFHARADVLVDPTLASNFSSTFALLQKVEALLGCYLL